MTRVVDDLCGVELSEGGVACILERAGEAAQPPAAQIGQQVQQSEVIGSDETSARVQGKNWWQWVFRSEAGVKGHNVAVVAVARKLAELVWTLLAREREYC